MTKMNDANLMSRSLAAARAGGGRPVAALKPTKTYAAFKASSPPPKFQKDGAKVADLIFGWRREKLPILVNHEQGLIQNRRNGNVAFLSDAPGKCIIYRE